MGCDVNEGMLSVRRMVSAGNRVVFDKQGSYIEDPVTKEVMRLEERQGMYILRLWIKNPKKGLLGGRAGIAEHAARKTRAESDR